MHELQKRSYVWCGHNCVSRKHCANVTCDGPCRAFCERIAARGAGSGATTLTMFSRRATRGTSEHTARAGVCVCVCLCVCVCVARESSKNNHKARPGHVAHFPVLLRGAL